MLTAPPGLLGVGELAPRGDGTSSGSLRLPQSLKSLRAGGGIQGRKNSFLLYNYTDSVWVSHCPLPSTLQSVTWNRMHPDCSGSQGAAFNFNNHPMCSHRTLKYFKRWCFCSICLCVCLFWSKFYHSILTYNEDGKLSSWWLVNIFSFPHMKP